MSALIAAARLAAASSGRRVDPGAAAAAGDRSASSIVGALVAGRDLRAADRAARPARADRRVAVRPVVAATCSAPTSSAATCSAASSTAPASRCRSGSARARSRASIGGALGAIAGYFGGSSTSSSCGSPTSSSPSRRSSSRWSSRRRSGRASRTRCSRSSSSRGRRTPASCAVSCSRGDADYVAVRRLLGASGRRALVRDVAPEHRGPFLVLATLDFGNAVLLLSGLSFLGLGAQPPTAEWGSMVSDGAQYFNRWWLGTFPGPCDLHRRARVQLHRRQPARRARSAQRDRALRRASAMSERLLEVRDLRVRCPGRDGPVTIVDGIDFCVGQGEVFGIAGESGSGKTMIAARAARPAAAHGGGRRAARSSTAATCCAAAARAARGLAARRSRWSSRTR